MLSELHLAQWIGIEPVSLPLLLEIFPLLPSAAAAAAAAAKSLQSCPTLCDSIDSSPWGCPVPGILQATTLEWVAISFSNTWKWSHSVVSNSSQPHGLQHARPPCPSPSPGVCPSLSTESVMLSSHLILCLPLLLLPSAFPSIRVFSNELVLTGTQ